ncbi:MAG: tandem-95 repeat protein, partial [Dehalococcoidia bacterium]
TYHANDGTDDSNTATVTITINPTNDAPVAVDDAYSVDEDDTLNEAAPGVLGNDTDVDGDTLTAVLDTGVSDGTLTLNADGSFTYDPDADFHGSDSFTYHANDGTDDSNTATVTIIVTPMNDAPVAADDSATTNENTPVNIDVLFNDSDPDGDPMMVTAVSDPPHGSTVINLDYTVNYTPDLNYNGADSFTYTVSDGTDTDTGTVSITVNPAPAPVVYGGPVSAPPVLLSIEVTPGEATIAEGEARQFRAVASYSGGTTRNVTAEATWGSSDNNVATVDAGLATGVAEGTTGITATLDGVTSNEAALSVTAPAVVSVEVAPESGTIGVGDTVQFTATATYSDGTTVDITGQATWNSSDPDVATINAEGLATGEGEGTVEITVTLDGVTSDPVTLTVTAAGAVLQWWAILAIVAGSLALALLLFTMLRRRRGLATGGS